MNALIRSELLKLRSTRAPWVALGVVAVFSALLPIVIAFNPDGVELPELTPAGLTEIVRAPANLAGGAVLLVGLLSAAGEFRHHTVLTTRLVEPRQLRVFTAKMLAAGLVGICVGVIADVIAGAGGAVALSVNDVAVEPLSHDVPRTVVTTPVLLSLHGIAGVAIGTLIRSTAGAIGATFLWVFVVEGVIPAVTGRPEIGDWLPGGAAQDVLTFSATSDGLTPGTAAALLVGYIAALIAAAAALDVRREL